MNHVLLVEDSVFFSTIIKKRLETEVGVSVHVVASLRETNEILRGPVIAYDLALVDLNLPDAPNGEVVDSVLKKNIPTIVFTGMISSDIRNYILSRGVVDYILKDDAHSLDLAVALISRLIRNASTKILMVDDSRTSRHITGSLLRSHQYKVYEAAGGEEALAILDREKDIRVLITDYNMSGMNGVELTRMVRSRYSKEELAVIGMSAYGDTFLSALFIKNGANDFINKPFLHEEFHCRVTHNVEMLEYIRKIRELSNKDYLTGLYNRRYFFDVGAKLFSARKRKDEEIAVAILDIDHFKKVNDCYGHDAGDLVLQSVARVLANGFEDPSIVARFGGEEFCVLTIVEDRKSIADIFERLRKAVEEHVVKADGKKIRTTISIGVSMGLTDSLESMIGKADTMLYRSKNEGRNRVTLHCYGETSDPPAGEAQLTVPERKNRLNDPGGFS